MDKQTIINYATKSPENTNPAVLNSLLDQYAESSAPTGTLNITANGTYDVSEYAEAAVSTKYPNDTCVGMIENFSNASLNIVYYDGQALGEIKALTIEPAEGDTPKTRGLYAPYKGSTVGMPFMKIQSSTPLNISGEGVGVLSVSQVMPSPMPSSYTYCLYLQAVRPMIVVVVSNTVQ